MVVCELSLRCKDVVGDPAAAVCDDLFMSFSASDEPDQMVISLGTRRASVVYDEPTATFALDRVILESVQTKSSRDTLRPVRAVVDVIRHHGGLMPRALLGGVFTPSEDETDLLIEVQTSAS